MCIGTGEWLEEVEGAHLGKAIFWGSKASPRQHVWMIMDAGGGDCLCVESLHARVSGVLYDGAKRPRVCYVMALGIRMDLDAPTRRCFAVRCVQGSMEGVFKLPCHRPMQAPLKCLVGCCTRCWSQLSQSLGLLGLCPPAAVAFSVLGVQGLDSAG